MESCRRPNRSDVHLSAEQEAKMEEKTRHFFDEKAPKRHTKPQRSEYSSQYVDAVADGEEDGGCGCPEYAEFQRLQTHPEKLQWTGNKLREEFAETEYYKNLNCIDKQHHTTGTGFIKMKVNGRCFNLEPDTATTYHDSCRGNPATNEWIPAASDVVSFSTDKPNRSDN